MWRYYWDKKNTVDDYKQISTQFFCKYGYFKTGKSYSAWGLSWSRWENETGSISFTVLKNDDTGVGHVRVYFTQTNSEGEKKDFDYKIPLESTMCNYGGRRWWFLCPCRWNRCSILYLQSNGIFASRKTLDLTYDSRNETKNCFWKSEISAIKAMKLQEKIKYKYRNGKPTRKMRQFIKYVYKWPSAMGYTVDMLVNASFGRLK